MRRLPSSNNRDGISDEEIDEVFYGTIHLSIEVPLLSRDYGERILYIGMSSRRTALVEIGIEDQNGQLVIFHARQASSKSMEAYEAQINGRS